MRRILSACAVLLLMASPAQADVFEYHNPDYDFSVTFPDDWRQMNVTGNDRFRVQPMHGKDDAQCYMNVKRDGRLTIYSEKYMQTANALFLDDSFWKSEVLADHLNYEVMSFYAPAGLGPAYATSLQWVWRKVDNPKLVAQTTEINPVGLTPMADIEVTTVIAPGSKVMQAISTAAIYGENRYRFTCQAESEHFGGWRPVFSDIFDSIKLKQKYFLPTGYYRNFLK